MLVRCSKCGKKRRLSPCDLRKSGKTEETYLCRACTITLIPKQNKAKRNDYSHFNKLNEAAFRYQLKKSREQQSS